MHRLHVPLVLLLLASLPAGAAPTTAPATAPAPSTQPTAKVRRGDLAGNIEAPGVFEPVEPFELRIRPRSYQGELLIRSVVSHGARVKKGDVLIQLDRVQINRQVHTAENELVTAQANLAKAQADLEQGEAADRLAARVAEEDLSSAEAGLKWWDDVDGKQMLQAAELAVKTARDAVGDQEDELEQLRKMYQSEELTTATADIVIRRALRQLERGKIQLGMAEARAEKVKNQDHPVTRQKLVQSIQQQRLALARLKTSHEHARVARVAAATSARLAVEAATEKRSDLEADRAQFTVTAPFDGVVLYGQYAGGDWKNADPRRLGAGDPLPPSQVLLTLFTPGKLRFVADLPEPRLFDVPVGQPVTLTPAAMPGMELTGKTLAPSPIAKSGGAFELPVELTAVDLRLAPGMKGTAVIRGERLGEALLAPTAAAMDRQGSTVGSPVASRPAPVAGGKPDGQPTQVRSGLGNADNVLIRENQ